MPPPNQQGLRIIKNRQYVDLDDGGTVMVAYDAQLETYRAKRANELLPSGPALYRIGNGSTWGPEPMAASVDQPTASPPPRKRPRLVDDPPRASVVVVPKFGYSTPSPYTRLAGPDSQGYYRLKKLDADHAEDSLYAFSKDDDHWVLVDPPEGRMDSSGQSIAAERLPSWTDRDIWEHYGLHGNDITRFRSEAETTGRKPQWAHARSEGRTRDQLIRALKWAHPDKSAEERGQILQGYNLLPSMLPRLQQALQEHAKLPEWAEAHKLQSATETHPQRFDLLEQEVLPQIRNIRNFEPHSLDPDFDAYYSRPFLEAFLLKIGYRKNIHGCLYRTDIPAMFRTEDRTPFELARDGCMLARENHPPGSTTKKALSATFSLNDAKNYSVGGGPGIGQLRYNTQTNKYPGRHPDSDSDSDADSEASADESASNTSQAASSSASGSSRQQSEAASTGSGSRRPISLDSERGYTTYRHRQTTSFIYMIDTRNVEVVPGQENRFFNHDPQKINFFPYDDIEGHISVSDRGVSAERIWLVNSSLTRAANVRAIHQAAGQTAADIESATWSGVDNSAVYDRLIDQVAASGGTVLNWPANGKIFADDVTWPAPDS
ncbi:hypothetical protein [Pseudomonas batumici]|uniref:Uncharacterized protein n=1 Tax=Pseudomonas batumici TaxID=226910 RepID=A0A0C2I708_9PSED|nr:hypothetical protein [Pseudomonas batumici]KIH82635.1 hypothetical protein UCMB321_3633 [Pseudomonas batumici]